MTPDPADRIPHLAQTAILGLDHAVLSISKAILAVGGGVYLITHPDQVIGWVYQIIGGGS
jgi:L-lactate utilization protein LutB